MTNWNTPIIFEDTRLPDSTDTEYMFTDGMYGRLKANYFESTGLLNILSIFVSGERRRQGLGRALLETAVYKVSWQNYVKSVHGVINSRVGLDLAQSVFGEDAVTVLDRGSYSQDEREDKFDALGWLAATPRDILRLGIEDS